MLWEETGVGKGFGLNCRTEVQELTLIGGGGSKEMPEGRNKKKA